MYAKSESWNLSVVRNDIKSKIRKPTIKANGLQIKKEHLKLLSEGWME